MIYDLSKPIDLQNAREYFNSAWRNGESIKVEKWGGFRTLQQNSYLHVLLQFVALEVGETVEYVKRNYYKKAANYDLFVYEVDDRFVGLVEKMKSSSDLTVDEMKISIDRFMHWCFIYLNINLPDSGNKRGIDEIRMIVENNKTFLFEKEDI